MINYSTIRDEDIRDLVKLRFGVCKKCINKLTKEECISLLNMRDGDGEPNGDEE